MFRTVKRRLRIAVLSKVHELVEMARVEHERLRTDRAKASMGSCGLDVRIHAPFYGSGLEKMNVGDNVHIARNAYIRAEGGVIIGDHTHISRNLVLYSVNHRWKNADRLPYDEELEYRPVVIGENVWIGMNVCICPGAIIHDGAIVGMGTVISGEVPPFAVVGGMKWRVIGQRSREHYQRLVDARRHGGANGKLWTPPHR